MHLRVPRAGIQTMGCMTLAILGFLSTKTNHANTALAVFEGVV